MIVARHPLCKVQLPLAKAQVDISASAVAIGTRGNPTTRAAPEQQDRGNKTFSPLIVRKQWDLALNSNKAMRPRP